MQDQARCRELREYPIHMAVLPPPVPFNRKTALRWLREEAAPLIRACAWGMMNGADEPTREAFHMLLTDADSLLQAAAEVVGDGKPIRPIALDPSEAETAIKTLATAVRSALCDQKPRHNHAPKWGFDALAEILEERVKIEHGFKSVERIEAIERLGYPMAVEEESAGTDDEEPAAADVDQPLAVVAVERDEFATCGGCGRSAPLPEKGLPEGWNGRRLEGTPKQTQHHDGVGLTYLHLWLRFCSEACADEWICKATCWPADNVRMPIEPSAAAAEGGS